MSQPSLQADSPWVEDYASLVRVRPCRYGGRPGLVAYLPAPIGHAPGTLAHAGAVAAVLMVQGPDDTPWFGRSTHAFPRHVLPLDRHPRQGRMNPVVAWLGGHEAWGALVDSQGGEVGEALDAWPGGAGRVAALIRDALPEAGFDGAFLDGLRAAGHWAWGPPHALGPMLAATEAGERLRALVVSDPIPTAADFEAAVAACGRGPATVVDAFPGMTPALSRRLRAPAWSDPGRTPWNAGMLNVDPAALVRLACRLPVDWIPTEAAGLGAFLEAAGLLCALPWGVFPPERMAASCGGDWDGFLATCRRAGHRPGIGLGPYLADPVRGFVRSVVTALGMRHGAFAKGSGFVRDPAGMTARVHRALYRDKGLPGCIEAAVRWHARLPRILSELPVRQDEEAWPSPWPVAVSGGYEVVPLTDPASLAEEGSPGLDRNGVRGLDHCVATYDHEARAGTGFLFSVRSPKVLPYRRVATGLVRFDAYGHAHVAEFSGHANEPPPQAARRAFQAYVERRSRGMTPPDARDGLPAGDPCGYDWSDDAAFSKALSAYAFALPREIRTEAALLDVLFPRETTSP